MEVIDLKGRKGLVVGIANEHSLARQRSSASRADSSRRL